MVIRNRLTITLTVVSVLALLAAAAVAATPQKTDKPASTTETPKQAAPVKGALDGKFFKGEIGQEGQASGTTYFVMFRNGMLHAHGEKGEGERLEPAAYTATESSAVWTFTATTNSPKWGQMEWQGTVKGSDLEATITATQSDKAPVKMWVKAAKAPMPERSGKPGASEPGKPKGSEPPATPPKTK